MAFRFQKLRVYHLAKAFHRKVVFLTKLYPREFFYLKDQLRRASLSIVLQIAEGSGKGSDRDFNRYVTIALGSGNEVAAGLEISKEEILISEKQYCEALKQCEDLVNQLGSLSKKLKSPK